MRRGHSSLFLLLLFSSLFFFFFVCLPVIFLNVFLTLACSGPSRLSVLRICLYPSLALVCSLSRSGDKRDLSRSPHPLLLLPPVSLPLPLSLCFSSAKEV